MKIIVCNLSCRLSYADFLFLSTTSSWSVIAERPSQIPFQTDLCSHAINHHNNQQKIDDFVYIVPRYFLSSSIRLMKVGCYMNWRLPVTECSGKNQGSKLHCVENASKKESKEIEMREVWLLSHSLSIFER